MLHARIALMTLLAIGSTQGCSGTDFSSTTPKKTADATVGKPDKTTKGGTTTGTATKGGTTGSGTKGGTTKGGETDGNTNGGNTDGAATNGGNTNGGNTNGGNTDAATTGGGATGAVEAIDDSVSIFKECKVNLSYNPEQIQCNLPVSGNHVWNSVDGWKQAVAAFVDKSAAFISPLPAQSENGAQLCALLDGTEKLIYVAFVQIPTAGSYAFDAIMDDVGRVRFWKQSDPTKEAYVSPNESGVDKGNVNLEAAGYAVVVEARDVAKAATAMAFSLRDGGGSVLKRSVADGTWCIFRVPASTDVKAYLPTAAGCRACFGNL